MNSKFELFIIVSYRITTFVILQIKEYTLIITYKIDINKKFSNNLNLLFITLIIKRKYVI